MAYSSCPHYLDIYNTVPYIGQYTQRDGKKQMLQNPVHTRGWFLNLKPDIDGLQLCCTRQ